MRKRLVLALTAMVLGVVVYVGNVMATDPPPPVSTTILAQSTIGNLNLLGHSFTPPSADGPAQLWLASLRTFGQSDLYVVDNKLAPGSTTGWHSHPGPSIVFVVAGTVTNYTSDDPTCTGHTYSAGQSFVDGGGIDVHTIRNETTAPAETIAVQFLPAGALRKTPANEPPNCHI